MKETNRISDAPIGLNIAILSRAFKKRVDEKAKEMGLTSSQMHVLTEISLLESSSRTEISQRMLEERVQVTHPTMTGILRRLETKGFIRCTSNPSDRRFKMIRSTGQAAGISEIMKHEDETVLRSLCKGLSEEEIALFLSSLQTIVRNYMNQEA